MDDQQPYKSSELIEKIDKCEPGYRIKDLEELLKEMALESSIKKLEDLLDKLNENVKEKATDIFDIGKYSTAINLDCNKIGDEDMWCESRITIRIYNFHNEDQVIDCYSDTKNLPYKIECTYRNIGLLDTNHKTFVYKPFVLSDSNQSISFIKGIKNSTQDIFNILKNPEVFKDVGEKYNNINIGADVSVYLYESIEKNPEIIKDNYLFIYNNRRSYIVMRWYFY